MRLYICTCIILTLHSCISYLLFVPANNISQGVNFTRYYIQAWCNKSVGESLTSITMLQLFIHACLKENH